MSWVRNLLVSFGAYWLSLEISVVFAWLFLSLTNGIVYRQSVLSAIAMGLWISMGRAVAAAFAGALVTFLAASKRPERWAFVVAILYVVDSQWRHHWYLPPTAWDRVWQGVDLLWPAIACVAAALVTARLRQKAKSAADAASRVSTGNLG